MKRLVSVLLLVLVPFWSCGEVWARGGGRPGGGGGRPGGGGFSRPSPQISRPSPQISRPSPQISRPSQPIARPSQPSVRPSQPSIAQRPATRPSVSPRPGGPNIGGGAVAARPSGPGVAGGRPSQGQLNDFLKLPAGGPSTLPGRVPGSNPAVADFLQGQGRPGGPRPADGAIRPGDRGPLADRPSQLPANLRDRGDLNSKIADNRGARQTERQQALGDRADNIRDQIHDHYDHDHLFDDFWANNPNFHYRFHQNPVFWTWAGFNTIAAFMPWNWGEPAYYDYGTGGNVYYEDNSYYVDGQEVPADQYNAGVTELATNPPEPTVPEDQMEWMPLGVFAIAKDGENSAVPTMFIQLAVSKEGIIAGAFMNKTTGETQEIEGAVDRESQRAAWTIRGKSSPIMETGLYNLTLAETKAMVHFADGQVQNWVLVRVEPPAETK